MIAIVCNLSIVVQSLVVEALVEVVQSGNDLDISVHVS